MLQKRLKERLTLFHRKIVLLQLPIKVELSNNNVQKFSAANMCLYSPHPLHPSDITQPSSSTLGPLIALYMPFFCHCQCLSFSDALFDLHLAGCVPPTTTNKTFSSEIQFLFGIQRLDICVWHFACFNLHDFLDTASTITGNSRLDLCEIWREKTIAWLLY